ncbi:MAG: DMT family transporter [Hylemonella sp.]|nr:DMT family transporter [Hylemonella sp.]
MKSNPHLAGILLMLVGMFLFTLNDALGKWLVADFSVGQILAIRSVAALLILLPYLWRQGLLGDLRRIERPGLQALRVVLVIAEVALFYLAVRHLPLADVFMFYLASPIFVTLLSALLLREQVGLARWIAVGVGFAGVVLIFPPSAAALTLPALMALAGSFSLALMMILARSLRASNGFHLITLQTSGVALAGAVTLPWGWATPSPLQFGLICLLGLVATTAHFMLNHAVKLAPANVVAPFQYSAIVWAMALGYLVWGDMPTASAVLGAALIVGAGLAIFFHETRAQKQAELAVKAASEV